MTFMRIKLFLAIHVANHKIKSGIPLTYKSLFILSYLMVSTFVAANCLRIIPDPLQLKADNRHRAV